GRTCATAGYDKIIRLWDMSPSMNPQFSPYLLSAIPWGRRPGIVPIMQGLEYYRLTREMRELPGHTGEIQALVFAPGGKLLISGGLDRTIRFWDPHAGKGVRQLEASLGPVHSLAVSKDGQLLATGDEHNMVRLWELNTSKELVLLPAHQGPVI